MSITDLELKKWTEACPEQYGVYYKGTLVAYIRLRFGCIRVDVPDCGGIMVYDHDFHEHLKGSFQSETERAHYLGIAMEKIVTFYEKANNRNLRKILKTIEQ